MIISETKVKYQGGGSYEGRGGYMVEYGIYCMYYKISNAYLLYFFRPLWSGHSFSQHLISITILHASKTDSSKYTTLTWLNWISLLNTMILWKESIWVQYIKFWMFNRNVSWSYRSLIFLALHITTWMDFRCVNKLGSGDLKKSFIYGIHNVAIMNALRS